MTKDELIKDSYLRISALQVSIDYILEDYDEYVQNVASNGNHDDTFTAGEDYGYVLGQIEELKRFIRILDDAPNAEHQTN